MTTQLTNGFGKVYLTLAYEADGPWVRLNWTGYQTFNTLSLGAEACLQLLRKHRCHYLLNDNSQVVGPWDHTVEWLVRDWAPRAAAEGLTHFATIVSPASLGASSSEALQTGVGELLFMRLFSALDEAQKWLRDAHLGR